MNTSKEGVTCIFNDEGELVSIIHKDMKSRKNVFYTVSEMGMDELEQLVKSDVVKVKTQ